MAKRKDAPTNEPSLNDVRIPFMTTAAMVEEIDQWRREQPELISRAEAIRQLIEIGLQGGRGDRRPRRG